MPSVAVIGVKKRERGPAACSNRSPMIFQSVLVTLSTAKRHRLRLFNRSFPLHHLASAATHDERGEKDYEEDHEQNLCETGRRCRDAAESQHSRDDCENQKAHCPA